MIHKKVNYPLLSVYISYTQLFETYTKNIVKLIKFYNMKLQNTRVSLAFADKAPTTIVLI